MIQTIYKKLPFEKISYLNRPEFLKEQEQSFREALTASMAKHGFKDPVYCWYNSEAHGYGNFIKIDGYSEFEDEREYFIKGEIKDGFLFASGMDGELKLDKNIIPSNFWNIDVMYQNEIFDTQKGIIRKLNVKESSKEIITINNKEINCTKFILNATRHPKDKDLFPEYTLWYSIDKELMKYKFRSTKNKKIIEVTRIE